MDWLGFPTIHSACELIVARPLLIYLPEKKQNQALVNLTKKYIILFQPFFTSIMRIFFLVFFFLYFFYTYPHFFFLI